MIHASISAESGIVKREVSRAGADRMYVQIADTEGRIIDVLLTGRGDLRISIVHPEHREATVLALKPNGEVAA